MTNAKIDENRKPTLIALSSEDGETIELVNAKNNRMMVVDGGTGPADLISKTLTPVSIKGGVECKIDNATGDIARTTSGWIEDEKYGWYATIDSAEASAEFDNNETRNGHKTLKFSNTNTSGRLHIDTCKDASSTVSIGNSKKIIPIKPSTSYRIKYYYKTINRTSSKLLSLLEFNGLTRVVNGAPGANISGTNDWKIETVTWTTNAATNGLVIRFLNAAGAIEDNWIDVYSIDLEEVSTITNASSTTASYYPKLTAVTSNDNIDQSQVVSDNTGQVGSATSQKKAQSFTPTKKNLTSIVIRKGTSTGTYIGNVTVSIQADSSGSPSGVDLGTPVTIPNATWLGITEDTDYVISYPLTLTIGGQYWIIVSSSTVDASNFTRIRVANSNPYSGGVMKAWNGTAWSNNTEDFYFKTLYSKNTTNLTVSTATQTVSVTSPTVDGWANGTVVNFTDALQLAPGANTVYVSSNGYSASADGTVDSSLQGTFGGIILDKNKGGGINAKIDENSRSTMTVLSSAGDGTIINLYVDPATKRLLIQS